MIHAVFNIWDDLPFDLVEEMKQAQRWHAPGRTDPRMRWRLRNMERVRTLNRNAKRAWRKRVRGLANVPR